MHKVVRYFHTLRCLKSKQLYYQLYYRVKKLGRRALKISYPLSVDRVGYPLTLVPYIPAEQVYREGCFTLLNRAHLFGGEAGSIDWEFTGYGRLWVYNLNYFDVLIQQEMTQQKGLALIESFIGALHQESVGLEPYPVSLRGINWIKFLSEYQLRRDDIHRSLYAQYLILERNLEYHLLGNHLLENAFSLLYGAFFFRVQRWFDKSRALLVRELDEQVLGDGGHFELSPMYHQILLHRLLDCVNLVRHNDYFGGQEELLMLLVRKAGAMIGWLKAMTFLDGGVPHLNDSTNRVAASSGLLFDYAAWVGIEVGAIRPVCLKDSGYRKYSTLRYECVVDVGGIGPGYIPGHAHADTLNFVMHVDGMPCVVDMGISTYEKNARRDEERSSGAHNCVVVNGVNSSDVWGGFRVGARAGVEIMEDKVDVVWARHDGYKRFGVMLGRKWEFDDGGIAITDVVSGEVDSAEAYFHFDRSLFPEVLGNRVVTGRVVLEFEGALRVEIRKYMQALGFNWTVEAVCAVVTFRNALVTRIMCNT